VKLEDRFWGKVNKGPGCWEWTAGKSTAGYGGFKVDGIQMKAHRFVWELVHGSIPDGMLVCHHCDNPGCVNPEHLFLGTPQDNMDDKVKKGRHKSPSGSRHGMAKLTEWQVLKIRELVQSGDDRGIVGARFGVSRNYITKIVSREIWSSVN
jgi:hypothetical protein